MSFCVATKLLGKLLSVLRERLRRKKKKKVYDILVGSVAASISNFNRHKYYISPKLSLFPISSFRVFW